MQDLCAALRPLFRDNPWRRRDRPTPCILSVLDIMAITILRLKAMHLKRANPVPLPPLWGMTAGPVDAHLAQLSNTSRTTTNHDPYSP